MTQWRIPLCDLTFSAEERRAVDDVLASGWMTMGPRTATFEFAVASYLQVPHAFLVASGTAALHLALMALEAETSRPVIVPAITFAATANIPMLMGHRVLLCDIVSAARPSLSPEGLRALLRDNPRAIVMPVHYAGYEAHEVWEVIADFPEVDVVEDAAHAIGGRDANGRPLGACHTSRTIGSRRALGCYSFFSNKNLTTGEGGLVVTHDAALAARVRLLRSHGLTRLTWERHENMRLPSEAPPADPVIGRVPDYDVLEPGYNYRPTEITAAIAAARLPHLDAGNARRRELLALYREALGRAGARLAFEPVDDLRTAAHIAAALFPASVVAERVRENLTAWGIQTSHHYTPLHRLTCYRERLETKGPFPFAEEYALRQLTLPLYPELTEEQLESVVGVVDAGLTSNTAF